MWGKCPACLFAELFADSVMCPRSKLGRLHGCHSLLLATKPCSPNTWDSSPVLGPFSSDHQPYQFMLSLTRGGCSNRESSPNQDAQVAQTRGAQPPWDLEGKAQGNGSVCACVFPQSLRAKACKPWSSVALRPCNTNVCLLSWGS